MELNSDWGYDMAVEINQMMIRGLKGAPISCLMAMLLVRRVMNMAELVRVTGYSDKSVNDALLILVDFGLATRNGRYGWQLADGVAQLPLTTLGDDEPAAEPAIVPAEQAAIEVSPVEEFSTSDENSPVTEKDTESFRIPPLVVSSSLTRLDLDQDPLLDSRADTEKLRVNQAFAALERAGVMEPKRSRLAAMPHVTAELVRYHVQTADNIRLAIWRIEHGWKIKSGWVDRDAPEALSCRPHEPEPSPASPPAPAVPEDAQNAWEQALVAIRPSMRAVDFDTWVDPLRLVHAEGAKWVVRACNFYARDWVREHVLDTLQAVLAPHVGMAIVLTVE